jgi:hypothetical protein
MSQDLIRTIILPVLLLIVIVAIGFYFYRGGEGFFNYVGDLTNSYSGDPDPTCPRGGPRSTKTGGICTGPVVNTPTTTTTTTTTPVGWISDISTMIGKCEKGVLVSQIRSGNKLEYYPYCFPNGITNADSVFGTTNKMTAAFSQSGTIATFYSGADGTGTIVGQLPQTNSQYPNIGQFPDMMFKSIKVVLPAGSTSAPPTPSSGSPSIGTGWTRDIDTPLKKCTTGAFVAQIRSGNIPDYYPFCFPSGITHADPVFNVINKATGVQIAKAGTTVTFYSDISGTGTVVAEFPQKNSLNAKYGEFQNLRFKSVKVVLPTSTTPTTETNSNSDPVPTLSLSFPSGSVDPMDYTNNLLKSGKGKLSLDLEYDGQKEWPSYASHEHELAHKLQASDLTKSDIQEMIQKELFGKNGSSPQVYCHDEDHEEKKSPALKQGCAMKKKNKKKCCPPKLQCDPTDYSTRKDNIPLWG